METAGNRFQFSELLLSLSLLFFVISFSNALHNNGINANANNATLNKLAPLDKFNSSTFSEKVMGAEGTSHPKKLKTRFPNKGQPAKPNFHHRRIKGRNKTHSLLKNKGAKLQGDSSKFFQASPLISVGVERLFPTINSTDPRTEMENLLKYGTLPYTFWKGEEEESEDNAASLIIIPFEPLNNLGKGTKDAKISPNPSSPHSYQHQRQRQARPHMNYEGSTRVDKGKGVGVRESETFSGAGGYNRYLDGEKGALVLQLGATMANISTFNKPQPSNNAFHHEPHQRKGEDEGHYQQVAPVPEEIAAGLVLLQVQSEKEKWKFPKNLRPPYANEDGLGLLQPHKGKLETDGFRVQGQGYREMERPPYEYENGHDGHAHSGFKELPPHYEVHTSTSTESEELTEGRITINNAIFGSKVLIKGTALVLLAVVGVMLMITGLAGAGVKLSPVILPVAVLPIAVVGLVLFLPSIGLFVPLVIEGLAGTERRRRDEKRRRRRGRESKKLDDFIDFGIN